MKKRLICLLLILIVAFSLVACNVVENTEPETDPIGETSKEEYSAPNFDEKGYVDHVFHGLGNLPNDTTYCQKIISSLDELQEFRSSSQVPVTITEYVNSSTERTSMNKTLDMYGSKYFEEGALVVLLWKAPSGEYDFTVKDVSIEENALNVTMLRWDYLVGHQAVVQWGAIIEFKKSEVDTLNVVEETIQQQMRISGAGLYVCLTHELSLETIYRDFTAEDFPELDFLFTVEDRFPSSREKAQDLLINEPTGYYDREYLNNYTRTLVITLTVKNREDVVRAVELLSQKEGVKWAEAIYEEYFEID